MFEILIILCFMAVVGYIICFHGQKLLSLAFALIAFLFSYQLITAQWGYSYSMLAMALFISVIAVLLVQYAQKAAFFLIGALIGAHLSEYLLPWFPMMTTLFSFGVKIGCGFLGGILFASLQKKIVRLFTSVVGGSLLAATLLYLISNFQLLFSGDFMTSIPDVVNYMNYVLPSVRPVGLVGLTVLFTIAGFISQGRKR